MSEEAFAYQGQAEKIEREIKKRGTVVEQQGDEDTQRPVDPQWLEDVKLVYGDYELVPMTADGDRGIVCQMYVA